MDVCACRIIVEGIESSLLVTKQRTGCLIEIVSVVLLALLLLLCVAEIRFVAVGRTESKCVGQDVATTLFLVFLASRRFHP